MNIHDIDTTLIHVIRLRGTANWKSYMCVCKCDIIMWLCGWIEGYCYTSVPNGIVFVGVILKLTMELNTSLETF